MYIIEIDEDKCTGCGECVKICPAEIYELDGQLASGRPRVQVGDTADCTNCESCKSVCAPEDITITEV